MKKILWILLLVNCIAFSQEDNITKQEVEVNSLIKGTLFSPYKETPETKLTYLQLILN